jgi:hypothetical protein
MKRLTARFATSKFSLLNGLLIVGAVVATTRADINGFNNGVNFTLNGGPSISGGTATLTDSNSFEARSVYYDTPQSITTGFTASFTYQATNPTGLGLADGTTFVLQNQGLSALGGSGSGIGYSGITPSAAVAIDVFAPGTAFYTNGNVTGAYASTSPVNLQSMDPIGVVLTYNGTTQTLTERLTDLTTSATFSTSYSANLASILGSGTALVGFTAGTGGGTSTQTVSNFTFINSVPEPGSLTLWAGCGLMMAAYVGWARIKSRRVA